MKDEEDNETGLDDKDIIQDAIEFLRLASDAESENRRTGLEALKFRAGQQWPSEIQNSRQLEQRPCLTINKTDAFCLQVTNQQRQQRPRIKVDPTGGIASKKVADVIKGMIRHIESAKGGADLAYDTAFDSSITIGWGYWRIMADYCREDSFEQELYLAPIDNPFSVYRDPNSTMPDGSDMERLLITDTLSKRSFRQMYPGKDDGGNFNAQGTGDSWGDWITKEDIRIAEFFVIRKKADTLVLLTDGTKGWKSDLPAQEVLDGAGVAIQDERPSFRRVVCWYKLTALEVLEKRELPGRFIPVVPMYGKVEVIDGKRKLSGLVKNAMDPARMFNFWRTAMTESIALAPKAKWLIAEGQDDGHQTEWATANVSAKPTLRYRTVDVNGTPAPPPQRIQPEGPPQGAMAMSETMGQDLTAVLGIIDPAMRLGGNVSGKALKAERAQSDNGNFHYYDNMTRSMRFTGSILLDLIPFYYSEPGRIVRIVGDDGRSKQATINQQNPSPGPETPGPIEQVLNDVTVGEYEVVMDTGPGYQSRRIEAVEAMMPLMADNEKLFEVAGDLVFRNMDFPGAEVIADRLAAANPLAQIEEDSEIPPGIQMKLKQQDATIQQLQQQLQAAAMEIKTKAGIEQMKQEAQTKRTLIDATAKVHANDADNQQWDQDIAVKAATARHDTEVRAITAVNVAEINQMGNLLKTKVDNAHDMNRLEKEADQNEAEVRAKANEAEPT